ncbi:MAG TPA: glycerophosphodiester phosphodiesterase [Bryobacteraceae bacterium]|nr:glycerophosphodiester phosphodiesterase [Bryobacteraceae bacterium]
MGRPILVYGHRGARAMRPENTLPGFEYAISVGADALEMDVAVTRDDVVVVSHDPKLNQSICRSPDAPRIIRDLTLAEVQRWDCGALPNRRFPKQVPVPGARVPTLDQVLALAGRGHFLFNIEVKSYPERPRLAPPPERFAELVFHVVRRHRLERRVIVQSFDFRILHAMQRLAPEIRRAALYVGRPKRLVAIAHRAGAGVVAPYHALASARQVRAAHAAGLEVVAWTANRPRDWKRLIRAQVDGIITDNPEGLLAYLKEIGLR